MKKVIIAGMFITACLAFCSCMGNSEPSSSPSINNATPTNNTNIMPDMSPNYSAPNSAMPTDLLPSSNPSSSEMAPATGNTHQDFSSGIIDNQNPDANNK